MANKLLNYDLNCNNNIFNEQDQTWRKWRALSWQINNTFYGPRLKNNRERQVHWFSAHSAKSHFKSLYILTNYQNLDR